MGNDWKVDDNGRLRGKVPMGDVVVEQRKWNVLVSVVSPYEVHGNSKD